MKDLLLPVTAARGSDRRVGPEQLDLRGRLFEVVERGLRGRGRTGLTVDREVEIEAIFERPAEHRPAVESGQVYVAARETIERMREAARPVRRDERERALGSGYSITWPPRLTALDDHEPGPVFRIVLDRLGQHVDAVTLRSGSARYGGRARLPLLRDRSRRPGRVVKGNRFDLARVQVTAALGKSLRVREGALPRSGPAEQAVLHGQDVFAHDAKPGQLPEKVRHLLHHAGAAVLHGQDRGIDGAHRERLERQPEGGIADRISTRKQRRHRLI